jgi:CubicO group peptidase (beta-lactamase class C family)
MDALIPSVSLALIDQDRVDFARAYGDGATTETLYQAASLSKFVAAVGALRLVDEASRPDADANARLTSRSQLTASTWATRHLCAVERDGDRRPARHEARTRI